MVVCLIFWVMSANAGSGANNVFPPEFVRLSKIGAFVLPIVWVAGMVSRVLQQWQALVIGTQNPSSGQVDRRVEISTEPHPCEEEGRKMTDPVTSIVAHTVAIMFSIGFFLAYGYSLFLLRPSKPSDHRLSHGGLQLR